MSIEFFITSIIVILLPGTGVLYTLAYGLGRGFRASAIAAFGCSLGIIPAAIASILGLAAILHTSALAFQIVKYIGVAYLLFMAWSILRDGSALSVSEETKPQSAGKIILNGVLLNILNPKLSMFFMAFLPQFVPVGETGSTLNMIVLATIFMGLTFVVFLGYGAGAALARDYIIDRPNVMIWLRRSFAGAFGALSLKLALAER